MMRRMVELVERMVGCSRSWSTIAIPILMAEHYLPFLGSVSISKILISRLSVSAKSDIPIFDHYLSSPKALTVNNTFAMSYLNRWSRAHQLFHPF